MGTQESWQSSSAHGQASWLWGVTGLHFSLGGAATLLLPGAPKQICFCLGQGQRWGPGRLPLTCRQSSPTLKMAACQQIFWPSASCLQPSSSESERQRRPEGSEQSLSPGKVAHPACVA